MLRLSAVLLFAFASSASAAAISMAGPNAFGGVTTSIASGGYHSCAIAADSTLRCWGDDGFNITPGGTFVQAAANAGHSCAIRTNNTVVCWGAPMPGPKTLASATAGRNFLQVAVGNGFACALQLNGGAVCWGLDTSGSTSPPRIGTSTESVQFRQIALGSAHACGIQMDGGTLRCWGADSVNYLGSGYTAAPAGAYTEVAAGDYHACAVAAGGAVRCWGDGRYGQTAPPGGVFRSLTAGNGHTCGIRDDATAVCWGLNNKGQSSAPAGRFSQLAAGYYHTCGVQDNGAVACWGSTENRQTAVPGGLFARQAVAAGSSHTCMIGQTGLLRCFGANVSGATAPPAGNYTQVSSGYNFSCGVASSGSMSCWGAGMQAAPGLFTESASGVDTVCGIKADQSIACSRNAQIVPEGWTPRPSYDFGQARPPAGRFLHIGGNYMTFCATRVEGGSTCWGLNEVANGSGQGCGQASGAPQFVVHQVSAGYSRSVSLTVFNGNASPAVFGCFMAGTTPPADGGFSQISMGINNGCALRADGRIACWGSDRDRQLTNQPAGTFTQVSAGRDHACAVGTDNRVACWGGNWAGQSNAPGGGLGAAPGQCANVAGRFSTALYNPHNYDASSPDLADGALEFQLKAASANFRGSGQFSMRKTGPNAFTLSADRLGSLTNKAGSAKALLIGSMTLGDRVFPEVFIELELLGNTTAYPNSIRVRVSNEQEELFVSDRYVLPPGSVAVQEQCLPRSGVVNTASLFSDGLVGPGSIATLIGEDLVPLEAKASAAVPLATTLGGVRVLVNGRYSPIFSVSPGRIDFQVPYETFPGEAELRILSNAETVYTETLRVAPTAPGIFMADTFGQAAARNEDGSTNSVDTPAAAESTIALYLTGLGLTDTQLISGYPGDAVHRTVELPGVTIGGIPAEVLYSGAAPGYVGLDQITLRLPSGVAAGPAVAVEVIAGGASSNFATIAVR